MVLRKRWRRAGTQRQDWMCSGRNLWQVTEKMGNKKLWFKIIFVLILIVIILYTFRGSWRDILNQLARTSPLVILLIAGASVVYHFFEGWITFSLARRYNPRFRYRDGVHCAFFCSFYRLSTLGSGQGVAAVIFLGKREVDYSEATGLYMIQYMLHKVSIALFSGILFLLNWKVMSHNYRDYAGYLILAYILTVLIAIGLILLAVYPRSHTLLLRLGKKMNFHHKLDGFLKKLESGAQLMEQSTSKLLKDRKTIITIILKNMAKLCFWYCIPFLILIGTGEISFLSSLSVTSLSVMTAAVIPTPAGIGSTELIMTSLYSLLVNIDKAAAITVLYRAATFIFPFAVGGVLILAGRFLKRFHKPGR